MLNQTVTPLLILLTLGLSCAGIATIWLGRNRASSTRSTPSRQQITWVLVTISALMCAAMASAGLVVALAPPMGPVRYVGAGAIAVLFFSLSGAGFTFFTDAIERRTKKNSGTKDTDAWDLDGIDILDFRENSKPPAAAQPQVKQPETGASSVL